MGHGAARWGGALWALWFVVACVPQLRVRETEDAANLDAREGGERSDAAPDALDAGSADEALEDVSGRDSEVATIDATEGGAADAPVGADAADAADARGPDASAGCPSPYGPGAEACAAGARPGGSDPCRASGRVGYGGTSLTNMNAWLAARLTSGAVVVAGESRCGAMPSRIGVVKVSDAAAAPSRDNSFGTLGAACIFNPSLAGAALVPTAIAALPGDSVAIAGSFTAGSRAGSFVVRLDQAGRVSTAFGAGGWVLTELPPTDAAVEWKSLAYDATNDELVAAGSLSRGGSSGAGVATRFDARTGANRGPAGGLLRDASVEAYHAAARGPRLYLAGRAIDPLQWIVKAFDRTWAPARDFGLSGEVYFAAAQVEVRAVDVDGLGRVVVLGALTGDSRHVTIARFSPSGSADGTFAAAGVFDLTGASWGVPFGRPPMLAIDCHNRILFGDHVPPGGVRRLTPDGALDATFGTGGELETVTGTPHAILVDPRDGRLTVVTNAAPNTEFFSLRVMP